MSSGLPHYRQEKKKTCALACLRMVLASFGTYVEAGMLQGEAHMETDGTEIAELERRARQFGLVADIEEATVEQLRHLLADGKLVGSRRGPARTWRRPAGDWKLAAEKSVRPWPAASCRSSTCLTRIRIAYS